MRRNNIKSHSHSVGDSMELSMRDGKCHLHAIINGMRDDEPQGKCYLPPDIHGIGHKATAWKQVMHYYSHTVWSV